ncbi:MAG TPA: hypothetical protein VF595_01250 [Tepidisphaeraceae bacterium]
MNPIVQLFILAIPIACVARTVVYEEIFRELRDTCSHRSRNCKRLVQRKFFYLFTCEYCFSHYVTAAFLLMTRYRLIYDDWRGYVISFFSLVFVANIYLSLYAQLKIGITSEKTEIELKKRNLQRADSGF